MLANTTELSRTDNEKRKLWISEQQEIRRKSNIPRSELYSIAPLSGPQVRPSVCSEFDETFCHDCFELPASPLRKCAEAYLKEYSWFSEQLLHDLQRNEEISQHGRLQPLEYVGGMDISFFPDSPRGVVSLVVLRYPTLETVKVFVEECVLSEDYRVGFLAFREAPHLQKLFHAVSAEMKAGGYFPQVLVIDGCGTHHPHRAGLATHLGVLLDIPTIGCAKNMLVVDGVTADEVIAAIQQRWQQDRLQREERQTVWDVTLYPIVGHSATALLYGYAVMTSNSPKKCIFVSPGHHMGFAVSVALVLTMHRYRIPEPTRLADLKSREFIRQRLQAGKNDSSV